MNQHIKLIHLEHILKALFLLHIVYGLNQAECYMGLNQRIANCSCTYLLVSAPRDILNKTSFMGESDKDRGDDKSSHSAIISDAGSWIIWQEDNTNFALDSRPSAPAAFHPHTHIYVALPLLTPCCLCIVNVGQKFVCVCALWTHSVLRRSPDTTTNINTHTHTVTHT